MIITLDHESARSVPNHVVVHGAVAPFADLTNWCIKPNTILDDVMNPVVSDLSTRGFCLHDLNHCAIGLQMADVPDFIVEHLGCISDGEHR